MKKLIALLLAVATLAGVCLVPLTTLAEGIPAGEYGVNYVKYGDVDANQKINANDALKCLQYSVGKAQLDEVYTVVADVSGNSKVDAEDALMILKLSVEKIKEFTAGVYYVFDPVESQPESSQPEASTPDPTPTPTPIASFAEYMMSYDKSNSVNGAYVNDPTADCSYSVDISSLAPNTIYRVNASVYGNADQGRLLFSLQGLINRDFGKDENHTSIIYCMGDTSDSEWLKQITAEGTVMQQADEEAGLIGMSVVRISTWEKFYEIFAPVIKSCGMILWDGNVPATSNVAATICGLDGYLPVLAKSPLQTSLTADGVPTKQTLVGLFADGKKGQKITGTSITSTGSAKNDAYLWALEKYFPRCSSTYLAYILDGAICIKDYDAYANHPVAVAGGNNCLSNHDYLIARRAFFFDLAPYKGEVACDDPAQKNGQADIGLDNQTMLKIYQARYDRANGAFGQLMGFPPWWAKYCTTNNNGSKASTWIEWLFCEYITCYNLAKEADAQAPASMNNGSVYYKYIPQETQYTNNTKAQNISYDSNTFYYTIYVGDYDSSAWLKEHVYQMWIKSGGDKYRGTLPLMWSINPNLSDRVPMIFDYMYENLTDMDYMVGGDGGAGYIIPEALFQDKSLAYMGEKRPAGNATGGGVFAAYSKKYYDRFGMEMTGFIINGSQPSITANIADCFSRFSPKLNFTNCYDTRLCRYGSTYFVYCHNGINTSSQETMYAHAQTTRNAGYNFSAFRTVCLAPKEINEIVTTFDTYASGKGMKVKYVDPYTYYNLLKASGQGTNLGTASAPSNPVTPTPDPYIPPDPNVLISFDSTTNITTAFSTAAAIETNNKSEGSGALRMDFGAPTGQASGTKIGGMIYYEFDSTVDLSDTKNFTLDYWLPSKVNGSAGLQINFVTNGKDDGYNFMVGINDATAGWHTITLDKSKPSATAKTPDWSSIRAVRITYFNYANNTTPAYMMVDNLKKDSSTSDSSTPEPSEPSDTTTPTTQETVLVSFDATTNVTSAYSTSFSVETVNKSQGSGALRLGFGNPTGQSAGTKIGGMMYYEFPAVMDLSAVKEISLDYWLPEKINGAAGIQINFVSSGKDDGYNFMTAINDASVGWHTITLKKSNPTTTVSDKSPDWSAIRVVRITYYNYDNNTAPTYMLVDNLKAAGGTVTTGSSTATEAVLVNFDTTTNCSAAFSTTIAAETANVKEGAGALKATFGNPTGQSAGTQIGGMVYYEFTSAVDLSAVKSFTLDFYVPEAVSGSAGLQVNFVTNGKEDGYNFTKAINDTAAGWHTITMDKASPTATSNNPDWSSIRAVRITYFNYANNTSPTYMMFDNLKTKS